jgi:hypothetical protein
MNELSDKNRPKKLEDIFREGMEEAEMAPSDLLWSRIERDLNIKEAGYYKERLVWYQRLAAACVVLVLFAGGYLFWEDRQDHQVLTARTGEPPAPVEMAKAPEALLPGRRQAAKSANTRQPITNQATPAPNNAAAAWSQPVATIARQSESKSKQAASPALAGAALGDNPADDPVTSLVRPVRVAQAINEGSGGSAALKTNTFLPTNPDAGAQQSLTKSPQPAETHNLPFVVTPTGPGRLALLQDSVLGTRSTLAAASLPQEESEANKGKRGSRWRFGGKYASQYFDQNIALANKQPALASNTIVPSAMLPVASAGPAAASYADALKEFDQETSSGFSFNTGLSAAYQLNNHLDLETGLGYTQNVAVTNTSYIFNNAQITNRYSADYASQSKMVNSSLVGGGIPSTAFLATIAGGAGLNQTAVTKTQSFDTHYRYRLLGIPVKVSYQTNRSKSFYFASMGMLTNLLVQANILSESERVPDLQYAANAGDSPFRNWHFAAVASAGKGFEITPGLQVRAGLEATQYLTSLTHYPDNLGAKQRKPYTIGLALSSSYTFGK